MQNSPQQKLHAVDCYLFENKYRINAWLSQQESISQLPIYASMDMRYAGYKCGVIDTNLFPAGFNNLSERDYPLAALHLKNFLERIHPNQNKILIIPENHTRNMHYLNNLVALSTIVERAGYQVRIGSLLPELTQARTIELDNYKQMTLYPVIRKDNSIIVDSYTPDIILLNNDLSLHVPSVLTELQQPILPTPELGWWQRKKSQHFYHYARMCKQLAEILNIDPWLLSAFCDTCDQIDFNETRPNFILHEKIQILFNKIEDKYKYYGINFPPFVVMKADAGTYGMGVSILKHPDDILKFNRKQRKSMLVAKGNKAIESVILQEGIYTIETHHQPSAVAEPVLYTIGGQFVGGFYRLHAERSMVDNLNTPGMRFDAFPNCKDIEWQRRKYCYEVTARLALLAAAKESADMRLGNKK